MRPCIALMCTLVHNHAHTNAPRRFTAVGGTSVPNTPGLEAAANLKQGEGDGMASPEMPSSLHYEPLPRFAHCCASVGPRSYVWGGCIEEMTEDRRLQLASVVEVFDAYLEEWTSWDVSGTPPKNLYRVATATLFDSLYTYGGKEDLLGSTSVHKLDTASMEWSAIQALNPSDGPMRKVGCGLFAYDDETLALFGGSGTPVNRSVPPGATQIRDTRAGPGVVCTNEFHLFHLRKGEFACLAPNAVKR